MYSTNGLSEATVWKNGIPATYSNGFSSKAESVFVSGSDVYVTGHGADRSTSDAVVKLWKNGVATSLTDGTNHGFGLSVFVKP
jgi:hypothetical protein